MSRAVARSRGVDPSGNAAVGPVRLLRARDNVVWVESVRATLIGVSDLVVVEANGELLVMPREEAARLNVLVREVEAAEAAEPEPGGAA